MTVFKYLRALQNISFVDEEKQKRKWKESQLYITLIDSFTKEIILNTIPMSKYVTVAETKQFDNSKIASFNITFNKTSGCTFLDFYVV